MMRKKVLFSVLLVGLLISAAYFVRAVNQQMVATIELQRHIEENVPVAFQIVRDQSKQSILIVGQSIDAIITIEGTPDDVLKSFSEQQHLRNLRVVKTRRSVTFQSGDISIQLTHLDGKTYRYIETFAL